MQLVNLSVICQVILLNFVTNSECQTIRDVSSASLEALPALDASKLLIRRGHVQEVQDRDDDSCGTDTCLSKGCVESAGKLLASIDETFDPCQDFYSFVCGQWIENAIIPQTNLGWSQLAAIGQQVAHRIKDQIEGVLVADSPTTSDFLINDFFLSCMDENQMDSAGLLPLVEMLAKYRMTMPLLDPYRVLSSLDIEDVLVSQLVHQMTETAIFGVDVVEDVLADDDVNRLVLHQPDLTFSTHLYTSTGEINGRLLDFYSSYMFDVVSLLSGFLDQSMHLFVDHTTLSQGVSYMISFEVQLARILDEEPDPYRLMTLKEFENALDLKEDSRVNLAKVIVSSLGQLVNVSIDDDTVINVPHLEYFRALTAVIDATPSNVVLDYLVFKKIEEMAPATTAQMRDLVQAKETLFTGINIPKPRWKQCVKVTQSFFGAKVSQIIIESEKGAEVKAQVERIFNLIKATFAETISQTEWMDGDTKQKALVKLSAMKHVIVGDGGLTDQDLDQLYGPLNGKISSRLYFNNLLALVEFWTRRSMATLTSKPKGFNPTQRDFDTANVNAFYSPSDNALMIPLGILHYPMFQEQRLEALNFGSIGMIMGHEMTHGFDNNGAHYDQRGKLRSWWTEATEETFRTLQDCFVDQYNNFTVPELVLLKEKFNYSGPTSVDGEMSLGENIADNGGLRQAYGAFLKYLKMADKGPVNLPGLSRYTQEQLFFISFGAGWCETVTPRASIMQLNDVHPPGRVRVTAVLQNTPEFAEAFGCKAGDTMVKEEVCRIW